MTIALPSKMLEQAQKVAQREGVAVDELITAAVERYLQEQWQASFEAESRAFERMHRQLLSRYRGQFVAVYGGQVVDSDLDKKNLARRVYERYGPAPIFFQQVTDEPIRTIHLRSPRRAED
ncbi:MAG: hypothetical protein E3J21_00435 [Anaerolineales bacterium]|nr:MAG: hypothetical protein E3J21_00435 [Anaerolineales bacterium]